MTYHLSRLRLASVGDRAARFTDLTADLTSSDLEDTGSAGEPTDSIVWLRNGGGKSSLLSLFFALLLPLRKDFLGKAVKRQLEDYVATGDTSHTVAEWVASDPQPGRQRLITGAVYEWVERRKPADPDRDRDKLKNSYYAFFAVPGVLDLDSLPIDDESGRRRTRSDFVRRLQEIAASRPQEFSFTITEQRSTWMDALVARNLDPALFRYQKQMNHSEGGVAELFDFPTTDKFIDFLIDLTVDSAQPDLVAANLKKITDILARKPQLTTEHDFCAGLADKLDILAEKHGRAVKAEEEAADARKAAAVLAGAFRAASRAQENDAKWYGEESDRLRESATKLDSERNRRNDTANELLRVAATHRLAAARSGFEDAERRAGEAKNASLAWEAVHWLAERVEAQELANSVQAQLSEEEQRTAPLRAARDDAAVALRLRYQSLADEESETEAVAAAAAGDAESSADHHATVAQGNRDKTIEATTRAENLRGKVIEIERAVEKAVDRGDLPDPSAKPSEVLAESRATKRTVEEQRETIRERRSVVPDRRRALQDERKRIAGEQATKTAERDQVVDERRKLAARVEMLATDARLAELVELEDGGRLNLWGEAAELRAALTHAAAAAELEIVDTRVDAADDDRALEGLRTQAFLPTTRDAQRAAETLIAGEIAARPGWHLLRDLVAEGERGAVLQNAHVAELAAGIVVADGDAAVAQRIISSADWNAVAHVPVCTATQLQEALQRVAPEWIAVPSDPALYDSFAAENARTEREVRRHEQDQHIDALQQQAGADRELLAALDALLRDCPAGYLEELERIVAAYNEAIDTYSERDASLEREIAELDRQDEADAETEKQLSADVTLLAGRIERLDALARRVSELSALQQQIEQLDTDARHHSAAADDAERRARELRLAAQAARIRAAEHKSNRERHVRDAGAISLLDAERESAGLGSDEPLSVLQTRFADFDLRWQTEASKSVLAERLKGLNDRVSKASGELGTYAADVQEQAGQLLATGDGQDAARRAAARGRSREVADKALEELSTARSELELAQAEVRERTPKDRPRHAQLESEPDTEADARRLAEEEAARATEMSNKATNLRREAGEAAAEASDAHTRAQVFQQQANRLQDAAAPADVPEDVSPHSGQAEAEAVLQAALQRLNDAVSSATETRLAADNAVGVVRRIAAESRFASVPDAIRDRFTADDSEVLARGAAAQAASLRLRQTTIEGQLSDIGRDQRLVVVEVAAMVRDVLATLESAHRHSKLPGTLGGWGNEHFLRIRFTRPTTEEDLHTRIDTVVERIVEEKSKPEGLALLKRCVHEAVAPRGFTVKVLKPNSDLAVEPVEVTQLGKFSGGEKLTVCVALYCTLARLRAVNRGQGKAAAGGTLVLDNPLGTASHVALLRLQRDVAAAHGVQLVYTTGVEDLGAVGQFPNVLRLRNAPGALRTRRYVVLEDRYGPAADGIAGARLSRTES
ncbi:hypothetical protein [Kribbella shirazensis]|uniref:Type III secretion system FlhB-like substrate exporter n=1 Tax=Kribbella shirazensis TaxID=1105143 RepID=A0A7X5VHR5_9ACTN|nr:hypothetical protein [Kribbella shirazensis]NIK61464.1 type III secretion system FlhB-like substrate exporter [Kribbella shirazensis]